MFPSAAPGAVLAAVIALVLAVGCGEDETAQTTTTEAAELSDEEQIEQVGSEWAPLFARDAPAACWDMLGQPLCEKYFGTVGEPAEARRPSGFQKSFADATVERVEIKGDRAGAEFSNGEIVEFVHCIEGCPAREPGARCIGSACPPRPVAVDLDWWVNKLGGNAGEKYFAGLRE
jgi:hypothetical protein